MLPDGLMATKASCDSGCAVSRLARGFPRVSPGFETAPLKLLVDSVSSSLSQATRRNVMELMMLSRVR
jgi:hypothetical protein